ncbi:MAG: RNA polymerase sigma factor [Vicinamibacterales bacterium]
MRDLTVSEIERLRAETTGEAVALEMDEEAFRGFYDRTARTLRAYLARVTGNPALADDLLQEAYYRFLRARGGYESEAHRRNALFRIATNLMHDSHRRARHAPAVAEANHETLTLRHGEAEATERATDLRRAMARLKPRERELLWLAYAQGSSHREIAECLGLRTGSVKILLFRARRRLAALMRGAPQAADQAARGSAAGLPAPGPRAGRGDAAGLVLPVQGAARGDAAGLALPVHEAGRENKQ